MKIAVLQKLIVESYPECFVSKKILDAGCGGGNFENLVSQKEMACSIVGVDVKEKVLEELKKLFPQYSFPSASLLKPLPFKDGEFDTVVMFDVIEHLPKGLEVKVLTGLNRVLKRGGWVIITTMHNTLLNFLDPAWYFGHRHYSKDELVSMVTEAGFKVKEIGLVGDLWWEFDTLLLYVCKYIFGKEYQNLLRKRFSVTNRFRSRGTRLCLVAQKLC